MGVEKIFAYSFFFFSSQLPHFIGVKRIFDGTNNVSDVTVRLPKMDFISNAPEKLTSTSGHYWGFKSRLLDLVNDISKLYTKFLRCFLHLKAYFSPNF